MLNMIHLDVSLLRMFPTAIGRIPPSFFNPACKVAPHKNGATTSGTFPAAMQFTRSVILPITLSSLFGTLFLRNTFKCSALNPSGPGAVPFLNDLMALTTSLCEKDICCRSRSAG